MTGHKHVPPSRDREPATERFKRVYNEQAEKPPHPSAKYWRPVVTLFVALSIGTALLCALGVMVWLVQWIGNML